MASRRKGLRVILNVYDLTDSNQYTHQFGLGVYHSGVEVAGKEYSFGGHEGSFSGIFTVDPRECPGARYRESIELGVTNYSASEVQSIVDSMHRDFIGNTYNLIKKNCNHFSEALCQKLLGKSIPAYVNRLAYFGALVPCLLPENLGVKTPSGTPTSSPSSPTPHFSAFSGQGMKLQDSGSSESLGASVDSPDEKRAQRERLLAAATKRLSSKDN